MKMSDNLHVNIRHMAYVVVKELTTCPAALNTCSHGTEVVFEILLSWINKN